MSFVQIIEFETADIDSVRKLNDEWEQATEGKRTARRVLVTRDRGNPRRYFTIVMFDSHESAMENSNLPETQEFAGRLSGLMDGEPTFRNLDVVEERL